MSVKREYNKSNEENLSKEEKRITKNKNKLDNVNNNNKEESKHISPKKIENSDIIINSEPETIEIFNFDLIEFLDEYNEEINNHNNKDNLINDENTKKNEKKNKKVKMNGRIYTKDEIKLYKTYHKAFHLLRKCIRRFKKRNKINPKIILNNYFNKWKNSFLNQFNNNIKEDKIEEKNKELLNNKYKTETNLNQNKINENQDMPIYKGKIVDKEKMNIFKNNKFIKKHIIRNENNYSFKSKKDKSINKLDELSKFNYKIQNEINHIIKNTDEKKYNKISVENYIQFLEKTNKNIIAYKIFLKYANNQENKLLYKQNPKKFYFNSWHKKCK